MKTRTLSLLVLLSFFAVVPGAQAATYLATYTVNQLGDTGTGQGFSGDLRYCIAQANANSPGPNLIKFQAGLTGTINLTGGLPDLMNKLTIQGPGANSLTVNGHSSRPFVVDGGATVFLSGLTLTGGVGNGAGLFIFSGGVLTLNNVAVSGNVAPMGGVGGGIWNYGTLTINSSTISGNSAIADQYGSGYGGGIYNSISVAQTRI